MMYKDKKELLNILKFLSIRIDYLHVFISINVECFLLGELQVITRTIEGYHFPDTFHSWNEVCIFIYNNCKNMVTICQKMNDRINVIRDILQTEQDISHCNLFQILQVPNEVKKIVDSMDDTTLFHIETQILKKTYYNDVKPNPAMKIRKTWIKRLNDYVGDVQFHYCALLFLLIVWDGSWTGSYYKNVILCLFICFFLLPFFEMYNDRKRVEIFQLCRTLEESLNILHIELDQKFKALRLILLDVKTSRKELIRFTETLQRIFNRLQSTASSTEKNARNFILATNQPSVLET